MFNMIIFCLNFEKQSFSSANTHETTLFVLFLDGLES